MYDPSSSSSSGPSTPDLAPVSAWTANTRYIPGALVWWSGSYWRCEVQHTGAGGDQPDTNLHLWTPVNSISPFGLTGHVLKPPPLWSPGPDSDRQQDSQPGGSGSSHPPPPQPPAGGTPSSSSSQTGIIAPVPLSSSNMRDHNASSGSLHTQDRETHDDDDDSPDSQSTVTAAHPHAGSSKSKGHSNTGGSAGGGYAGPAMSAASFFSSKADESLRFLTARQEYGKARDPREWEAEIKGKRSWRVGGLGLWAYDQDPGVEETKAEVWREYSDREGHGREAWLDAAQLRTTFYAQTRGVKPLITWRLVQPGTSYTFPPDALQIGHEGSGQPLFSARAWHGGGLHLGKAGPHLYRGCSISYGGAEINTDTFEVLCATRPDPTLLKWMCFDHGQSVRVEGWQPVEGGREKDGQSLLVVKGEWEGGQHPGKSRISDDHAHIGWGGGEVWIRPFYVLAYASGTRR